MKRNGFDEQEADKRIASQPMTNQERAARATVVLSNEGTEQDLVAKASFSTVIHLLSPYRRYGGTGGIGMRLDGGVSHSHWLLVFRPLGI